MDRLDIGVLVSQHHRFMSGYAQSKCMWGGLGREKILGSNEKGSLNENRYKILRHRIK